MKKHRNKIHGIYGNKHLILLCKNFGLASLKQKCTFECKLVLISNIFKSELQWNLVITRSLGPWKLPCYISFSLYQGKKTKKYKDQQNYLVIRGFCYTFNLFITRFHCMYSIIFCFCNINWTIYEVKTFFPRHLFCS